MNLRSEKITKISSEIAKLKFVRQKLLSLQREFANFPPNGIGSVIDGRDITSVIIPNAEIKFYIDADIEVRATRRLAQLQEKGISEKGYEDILSDLQQRDFNDKNRKIAPLIIPQGAVEIDNSNVSKEEVIKKILELIDIKQ